MQCALYLMFNSTLKVQTVVSRLGFHIVRHTNKIKSHCQQKLVQNEITASQIETEGSHKARAEAFSLAPQHH